MADINILGGLLSGGLRGIGQQMVAESERERRAKYAQAGGAQMFPDAFGPEGVANGDKLSSHMYAGGYWDQGLPLVTQAIGNRNAISMENLQQQNAMERLKYSNDLAMESAVKQAQMSAEAAYNTMPQPTVWAGMQEAVADYRKSETAYTQASNFYNEIAAAGTVEWNDPRRSGRLRAMADQLVQQNMRPGNASDEEYQRAFQSTFGVDSMDDLDTWFRVRPDAANQKVLGALQQNIAKHQLAAREKSDGLNYAAAGNKWLTQMWNQVAQNQPPGIANFDPGTARQTTVEQARRKQGLDEAASTREAYKKRIEEAQ
jgi:hypothetical protein